MTPLHDVACVSWRGPLLLSAVDVWTSHSPFSASISFSILPLVSFHALGPLASYPTTKRAADDELLNSKPSVMGMSLMQLSSGHFPLSLPMPELNCSPIAGCF